MRRVAAGLVLSVAAAAPARAQDAIDALLGRTVAGVRIEIEGEVTGAESLRALVSVPIGEPLRAADLRASLARLASLGTFEDERMDVAAAATAEGVVVTFRLWYRHTVDRIEAVGDTGLDPGTLNGRILDQFGRIVPVGLTHERVRATVERILRDEGFRHAAVTAIEPVETHDPHRATLRVTVAAGPRAIIAATEVVGESRLSPAEIQRRTLTTPGLPYREREVRDRLLQIRDQLGNQGYYAAETGLLPVRESENGAAVTVTLRVNAGPLVEIGWDRAADPPPGSLDDLVPARREGSVDPDLIDQGEVNLEVALRRQGYWKADVSYTRVEEAGRLAITYRIVRGRRYFIDRVELAPDLTLPRAQIDKLIDVARGDVFDDVRVGAGIISVIAEYRRRGYYQADADPTYLELPERETPTEAWVVVRPRFIEGPLGTVAGITFSFDAPAHLAEGDLLAAMQSRPGTPYVEARRVADEEALRAYYDARGYRDAQVEIAPPGLTGGTEIALRVQIVEGRRSVVGDIVVFGNTRLADAEILSALAFQPNDPFSERARLESESRLYDRGIYRRVSVRAEPALPGQTRVRVIVTVEESPATAIAFGGGVEVDTVTRTGDDGRQEDHLATSPRGFFQATRRNLGGRNRVLSFFSRLSLKPAKEAEGRRFGFADYRVALTFREFRAFETDTDLLLGVSSEQAGRTGFNFIRRGVSAEALRRLSPSVALTARYGLDFTELFDEVIEPDQQLVIDQQFPQVRLSTLSLGTIRDGRDNPIAPSRGSLVTADVETALRSIGSEVGYVKTFVQASRYQTLGAGGGVVFAGRAELGLARGFERIVELRDANGDPILGSDGQPVTGVVEDLPASQRFFAGGSTTVRGFQLDRLGVEEIIDEATGLSRGGNALIVLNAELRAVVARLGGRPLAAVAFLDAGNVFAKVGDADLSRLRATPGFGVRYDSPLGPIRFDIGFKTNVLEIGGRRERRFEFHLSIGEAF
jgi:outer membrane protein assembly factor BamA